MNYTEILERVRKTNIDVLGLYIAYECNGQFTFDYTEKNFWEEMQPIISDKKILDIIKGW